jgi:hypothetical protein
MDKRPKGRPPVKDPATEVVRFRCTPAEKAAYAGTARKEGVSLSAWLKALADRFIR